MESWRARLGVLASRGETSGPRVDEARAALTWHRNRKLLIEEIGLTAVAAEALLDAIAANDVLDKAAEVPAEAEADASSASTAQAAS
jgi:hypothetical protein